MKGFAVGLTLKQRWNTTQKWVIAVFQIVRIFQKKDYMWLPNVCFTKLHAVPHTVEIF